MKRLLFLLIMLFSTSSQAIWYEAIGQADTTNTDKEVARTKATQEAIKQALIIAGGSVSSVQQTLNGLMSEESIQVRANGAIQQVELVSEIYSGNTVTVTIRADIVTQEATCHAADYKKSLAITQFGLLDRHQAVVGRLYDIGKQIPKRMQNYLRNYGGFTQVKTVVDKKTAFTPALLNSPERLSDLITITADITDAQFVLFGMVNDISIGETESNYVKFWKGDKTERFFEIELFLYSGINGEQILNERFNARAEWDFDIRKTVDIRSRRFWESQYGQSMLQVIADAATNLDEQLKCQPSRARVISVQNNTVQFNLGSENGVQVGDKLKLLHLANFKDESGRIRSKFNISPFTVEVTRVYGSSAIAKSMDDALLSNVQPNDIVVRQ